MNSMEMKGSWNIVKGRVQQHWAKLTDDELRFAEGKVTELVGRIQKRTGKFQEHDHAKNDWSQHPTEGSEVHDGKPG